MKKAGDDAINAVSETEVWNPEDYVYNQPRVKEIEILGLKESKE